MSKRSLVSVVDDSESVRESLPDLLRCSGFDVQAFSSAEAFLESETVSQTRCLILDVGLPGMPKNGLPATMPNSVGLPGLTAMP